MLTRCKLRVEAQEVTLLVMVEKKEALLQRQAETPRTCKSRRLRCLAKHPPPTCTFSCWSVRELS
jgi:hypothetical protein